MWHCNDCDSSFAFPEIKRPDAGLVSCEGILGIRKVDPVMFCPECFSTKVIDVVEDYSNATEGDT